MNNHFIRRGYLLPTPPSDGIGEKGVPVLLRIISVLGGRLRGLRHITVKGRNPNLTPEKKIKS